MIVKVIFMNKESELANKVKDSIRVKLHKDFVRKHYVNYLSYINRNGIKPDVNRFEEVEFMFVNYIKYGKVEEWGDNYDK